MSNRLSKNQKVFSRATGMYGDPEPQYRTVVKLPLGKTHTDSKGNIYVGDPHNSMLNLTNLTFEQLTDLEAGAAQFVLQAQDFQKAIHSVILLKEELNKSVAKVVSAALAEEASE